jgi:hypothetical protein
LSTTLSTSQASARIPGGTEKKNLCCDLLQRKSVEISLFANTEPLRSHFFLLIYSYLSDYNWYYHWAPHCPHLKRVLEFLVVLKKKSVLRPSPEEVPIAAARSPAWFVSKKKEVLISQLCHYIYKLVASFYHYFLYCLDWHVCRIRFLLKIFRYILRGCLAERLLWRSQSRFGGATISGFSKMASAPQWKRLAGFL